MGCSCSSSRKRYVLLRNPGQHEVPGESGWGLQAELSPADQHSLLALAVWENSMLRAARFQVAATFQSSKTRKLFNLAAKLCNLDLLQTPLERFRHKVCRDMTFLIRGLLCLNVCPSPCLNGLYDWLSKMTLLTQPCRVRKVGHFCKLRHSCLSLASYLVMTEWRIQQTSPEFQWKMLWAPPLSCFQCASKRQRKKSAWFLSCQLHD